MEEFSEAVCEKLGNYVYRLIDPTNGETFYVGKGRNNHVFQHIREQLPEELEEETASKLGRIRDTHRAGLEVIHIIHRHEIPDEAVDHVEAALIDAYAGLTNVQGGYNSGSAGPMHATQLIQKYDLPDLEFNPPHKLLLLNVNGSFDVTGETDLYKETQLEWALKPENASKAEYILAVVRGVVKQVFIAEQWLPATADNFPDYGGALNEKRFGFKGRVAPADVREYYVGKYGKRITNPAMKHSQNPVRYWNF